MESREGIRMGAAIVPEKEGECSGFVEKSIDNEHEYDNDDTS